MYFAMRMPMDVKSKNSDNQDNLYRPFKNYLAGDIGGNCGITINYCYDDITFNYYIH